MSPSKRSFACYLYDVHLNMSGADVQVSVYRKFAASMCATCHFNCYYLFNLKTPAAEFLAKN